MAKGKFKAPTLSKPDPKLLARSVDDLLAENDDVLRRAREVRSLMNSKLRSRSFDDLCAEHDELMRRSAELLSAKDYKRGKTFRPKSTAAKRDG